MKSFSLSLIAFFCVCASLFAQDEILYKNASVLFENSFSTLSNAEKIEIFKLTGFELAANESQFYLSDDPDTADDPFDVKVLPLDLNDDGTEEIAIEYGNNTSSGIAGKSTLLIVKDMEGNYGVNFGFPGTLVFLNINPFTLPDILVRNRQPGFPIWRWNGMTYNIHEQFDNKKLSKMRITYLTDANKSYTVKVKK
ncbi:MAG: hypothetical protein HKN00_05180 [Flavobacteriaceae bacterium]|nr:hypothetical protein [Flavobacteriaceae bacterium]